MQWWTNFQIQFWTASSCFQGSMKTSTQIDDYYIIVLENVKCNTYCTLIQSCRKFSYVKLKYKSHQYSGIAFSLYWKVKTKSLESTQLYFIIKNIILHLEVFSGMSTTTFLPCFGREDGLWGVQHQVLKFKSLNQISVPNHTTVVKLKWGRLKWQTLSMLIRFLFCQRTQNKI